MVAAGVYRERVVFVCVWPRDEVEWVVGVDGRMWYCVLILVVLSACFDEVQKGR